MLNYFVNLQLFQGINTLLQKKSDLNQKGFFLLFFLNSQNSDRKVKSIMDNFCMKTSFLLYFDNI